MGGSPAILSNQAHKLISIMIDLLELRVRPALSILSSRANFDK